MVDKRLKKKKFIIKLSVFFLLLIILIISYRLWLPLPATFLLVKDNLKLADCIVPLLADPYFRFRKAVELYKEGYAKNIVVSYLPQREDRFKEYYNFSALITGTKRLSSQESTLAAFKYFGMDLKNLYFTELASTSTYDEAAAVRKFMLGKGFKSMILVTSTYHARRALMIFKLVFRNTDIKIYICTAKNELYNPHNWWLKEIDSRTICIEYVAMIQNFIHRFIFKKGKTPFDSY